MTTCEYCGKPIPAGETTCDICRELVRKRLEARGVQITLSPCRYNSGVDCPDRSGCRHCGWHPAVAARRLKKFREA